MTDETSKIDAVSPTIRTHRSIRDGSRRLGKQLFATYGTYRTCGDLAVLIATLASIAERAEKELIDLGDDAPKGE